jgi:hypothetical protein
MKKSRIFIGAATLILGITAFMATKANKKFVSFTTAVTAGGVVKVIGANIFTTVAAGGSQAYLATAGGMQKPLFTKTNRIKVAYLK